MPAESPSDDTETGNTDATVTSLVIRRRPRLKVYTSIHSFIHRVRCVFACVLDDTDDWIHFIDCAANQSNQSAATEWFVWCLFHAIKIKILDHVYVYVYAYEYGISYETTVYTRAGASERRPRFRSSVRTVWWVR